MFMDICQEIKSKSRLLRLANRGDYWSHMRGEMDVARERGEGAYLDYVSLMGKLDIFFFLVVVLRRLDADNDFVYEVCRDLEGRYVENELHDILHLYARGHYKSTIVTIAYTIRDLMIDSERTFCIFGNSNANSEYRISQIKREFEDNELLKALYPGVCWVNPEKESPLWSVQKGLVLRRRGNPKEASVEGWGILDGMPTGSHFSHLVYDDLVTEINVGTPEQIQKTTERWALSLNLDMINRVSIKRYIGTRYHYADTYKDMMERGVVAIIRPATSDGSVDGEPVLLSREILDDKIKKMGANVAAAQLFLNPLQVSIRNFQMSWVRRYESIRFMEMNRYLVVDPASSKHSKKSDYTVMLVIGVGEDMNYYLVGGLRAKLNLKQKWERLQQLHRMYKPMVVGYEEYGLMSDVEYFRGEMEACNYRFDIVKLGGRVKKTERIERLMPLFEGGRIYLPSKALYRDGEGIERDLVRDMLDDEYSFYPYCQHDDILDAFARILDTDMRVVFPMGESSDLQIFCNDDEKSYGF